MNCKGFTQLAVLAMLLVACGPVQTGHGATPPVAPACSDSEPRHCTVLTVSQGSRVFFGGNDDYVNRDSTYWVDPGSASRYGAIYFGAAHNIQQGFNQMGLAYDANGLAMAPVTSHPGRTPVSGGYSSYPIHILQECATVQEVIDWVQEHRWHAAMHDQLHFADATGDAVVIGAGPDGKVAFTRKPAGDGFLVSTNFNLANPSSGGYPCWRYSRAGELLGQIQGPAELTVERVASIMEAVHVEGPSGWTLYSVVADLPQRLVYVYFMFQYDAPVILKIDEEIAQARSSRPLSELFPEVTQRRANLAYQRLVSRPARCDAAGRVWLVVVALSLVIMVLRARSRVRSLVFWTPGLIVLGPFGLLAWLLAADHRRSRALVETIGDLPPYVTAWVLALLAAVNVPAISQNQLLQLAAFYGLPLVAGLLLYQAPLHARAQNSSYLRSAWRRLPTSLVSANLALAGLLAVGLPLVNWHLGYCGLNRLVVLNWWPVAVLGALTGGLPLYGFHAWAARRGLATGPAWQRDLEEGGRDSVAVSHPTWRRLWYWILLSFAALVAGIAWGLMVSARVAGGG